MLLIALAASIALAGTARVEAGRAPDREAWLAQRLAMGADVTREPPVTCV